MRTGLSTIHCQKLQPRFPEFTSVCSQSVEPTPWLSRAFGSPCMLPIDIKSLRESKRAWSIRFYFKPSAYLRAHENAQNKVKRCEALTSPAAMYVHARIGNKMHCTPHELYAILSNLLIYIMVKLQEKDSHLFRGHNKKISIKIE